MTALMPRSLRAWTSRVAVVRLPIAPSVPSTAMRGQVTSKMRPENSVQVLLVLGAAHVGDRHAGEQRGGDELGVVVEELVQPVDDVHAAGDAVEQHDALRRPRAGRRPARGRRSGSRAPGRRARWPRPGVASTGMPLGVPSRNCPASSTGPSAVDDAEDLVLLRVADQPVGGLAVLLAELALAVDDGRAADGQATGTWRGQGRHRHCCSSESSEEATGRVRADGPTVDEASALRARQVPGGSTLAAADPGPRILAGGV